MADKTLYDVLEASSIASPETIRAAFDRLSAKFDPDSAENSADPGARMRHDAVKEAFFTLGNAEKRRMYDLKLVRTRAVFQNIEVVEPFWTLPKIAVVAIALVIGSGFYYSHQKEQVRLARVEAEKAIATAKAREAEEQANAEAAQAHRDEIARGHQQAMDARQRREHEAALRQYSNEQRMQGTQSQSAADRERRDREMAERRAENQRRLEESRAQVSAQQQAAREKAELCRIERERYGRSISC
jgi:curved DNA-binding protein CbpA